jgi:predicted nucleic acid-binding protein
MSWLQAQATLTSLTIQVRGVATHPEDDLILSTALSGGADYLVTGDAPFRKQVPAYRGVTLISPRDFLALLQPPC